MTIQFVPVRDTLQPRRKRSDAVRVFTPIAREALAPMEGKADGELEGGRLVRSLGVGRVRRRVGWNRRLIDAAGPSTGSSAEGTVLPETLPETSG
jgi:hypothetical protein